MTNNKFQQGTVATIFGWLLLFVLVPNVLVLIISFLTENRQSAYFVDFSFSSAFLLSFSRSSVLNSISFVPFFTTSPWAKETVFSSAFTGE